MPDKFNNEGPVTKVNVGRLTNGIFVFTLLLIFKNIKLPSFGDYMLSVSADKFGLMQIPDIMSFFNAFIIVSMFWLIFFQIFNKIKKFNRVLLYLHICLLMMIIFIPIIRSPLPVISGQCLHSRYFSYEYAHYRTIYSG